jgi:cellulose biosynthesis protein BcsQ
MVEYGVGKTTTAVHLAAYLQTLAPTLLLDGDDTRNATAWGQRGNGFAFKVADEVQAARLALIIRPLVESASGLKRFELFKQCFLLVGTQLRSEFVTASAVARI